MRLRLRKEKRPEDRSSGLSSYELLVRLAGIEPTTPWFVAKYSIQLSYSRDSKIIAAIADLAKRPGYWGGMRSFGSR